MENVFTTVEEIAIDIKEYINNRIAGMKLSVAEKTSQVLANLWAGMIVIMVFFFFMIFAGIALSFGLGEWIGKTWAGFLVVAILYLLIGMIVWTARGRLLRKPIMNKLIQQLFNDAEDEKD